MSDTIHLEGYSAPLRKQKLFCISETAQSLDIMFQGLYKTYHDEVIRRNKLVVIFSDIHVKHNPKWLHQYHCDALFRIRDTNDMRLAATFIQHTSKPLCIIWYGNELPLSLFNIWSAGHHKDDITVITGGTNISRADYTSVFWSSKSSYDDIHSVLLYKMGPKNMDLKLIIQECKASEVSLVWSSFGEPEKSGSLYWFDFNSVKNSGPHINYAQASEYLRTLADALEHNDG